MPELTEEQKAAVECGGKCIVSASAGSGKTHVMITKICNYLETGDIGRILAITYTNAAASQMKEKLRRELINRLDIYREELKRAETAGDDQKTADQIRDRMNHIRDQINNVPYADVSTIHSFCSRLIRTYFYMTDADASYEIMDDKDAYSVRLAGNAIDAVFDRHYRDRDDKAFRAFLEFFRPDGGDGAIKKRIQGVYANVRNSPDYRADVARHRSALDEENMVGSEGKKGTFDSICKDLKDERINTVKAIAETVGDYRDGFIEFVKAQGTEEKYTEQFVKDFALLEEHLGEASRLPDIFTPAPDLTKGIRKPNVKFIGAEVAERYDTFMKQIKEAYKPVRDVYDRDTELEKLKKSAPYLQTLCDLVMEYDDEFSRAKRAENMMDYGDLEHYALQILADEKIRAAVRGKYDMVYVDEYQDVNDVQEEILNAVCGDRCFFVGDRKQSIYAFRGSSSKNFMDRKEKYESGEGKALCLTKNFRSCGKILDFANTVFTDTMKEGMSDILYTEDNNVMSGGDAYSGHGGRVEIDVYGGIAAKKEKAAVTDIYSVIGNDGMKTNDRAYGRAVLKVISDELKSELYDPDKEMMRPVRYGDICILVRKNGEVKDVVKELRDHGYPVAGAKDDNVCDDPEIRRLIDILSYIDNAEQDEPLCAFMLSPLGGFTENDLAKIRIETGDMGYGTHFRDRLYAYPANGTGMCEKIAAFRETTERYRALSQVTCAGTLIDMLCEEEGWEAEFAGNGGAKLRNLRAFQAAAYIDGKGLSLSAFLTRLRDSDYNVSLSSGADEDSIHIMTMHSAKGLEFPVVIISDIYKKYIKGGDGDIVAYDGKYGFASKYYDPETMKSSDTLLMKAVKTRQMREDIKNELNLFYVACTRAMYSLHVMAEKLTVNYPVTSRTASRYEAFTNFRADKYREYVEDMKPDALNDTGSGGTAEDDGGKLTPGERENLRAAVISQLRSVYPHVDSISLPVKVTASGLRDITEQDEEETSQKLYADVYEGATDKKPWRGPGGAKTDGDGAAARGTAYHRFLEACDFGIRDTDGIGDEIKEMAARDVLTEEQVAILNAKNLSDILNMDVFGRLSGEIYRERRFLCRLRAAEIGLSDDSREDGDDVYAQGIIDLLAVDGDRAVIVDYKYSPHTDDMLVKDYTPQLNLYKRVVKKLCGIDEKNIGAVIVNIDRCREIPLDI